MTFTEPAEIKVVFDQKTPVYKQLIDHILKLTGNGKLSPGDPLPSMNVLSRQLGISSETVKKAYNILKEKGVLESAHGIGFHVAERKKESLKILLLFDKISTYKQVIFNSFAEHIGGRSELTIRLHNQDIDLFEQFIEDNLGRYDYYLVTPHLPLQPPEIQQRAIKALKKIPNRKLIVVDRQAKTLPGNYGAVYQDFEQDAYTGLQQCLGRLKKYKKLNLISMPGSLYSPFIQKAVKKFCTDNKVPLELHRSINSGIIKKHEVYLILNSQLDTELIELVRHARIKGYTIGKDLGILSYNESPINEIILDGLSTLSTDFEEMGRLAAEMVSSRTMKKIKCSFNFIGRNSF